YAVIEADKRDPTRGFRFGRQAGGNRKGGVFRSTDRGETWQRMSDVNPRPMYFSQIRIDPSDPERIYLGATPLMVSEDGGKTFRNDGASTIHVDHHAIWIDPNDSDHLIIGNDGGVSASFDRARTWRMYDNLAIGQFYRIGLDMRDPYYVCGGMQDNSSWCGPSRTLSTYGIRNSDWYDVWGGDGFYNLVDPTNYNIVYTESQGGNLGRVDITTGEGVRIRPVARPTGEGENVDGERSFRWNWNTPILLSAHDPNTVYIGSNILLKSTDRGQNWVEVSPDLTKHTDRTTLSIMGVLGSKPMLSPNDGISSYGNITTIGESPMSSVVLYVGTDDGNVQLTRDGGESWTDLTGKLRTVPERTYVSGLVPSRFSEGRVYATFDGHRNDDYEPHVYVSENYGQNWRSISKGLPDGWCVNVIVEHPRNENLLFAGNEIGVFFSLDRGESWARLKNNLPTVPVDDIKIHPRDNDLVIGTHGRSIWIMPDVTPLEKLSNGVLASAAYLFPIRPTTMYSLRGGWPFGAANYSAPNPPDGALIRYYLREDVGETQPVAAQAAGSAEGGPSAGRPGPSSDSGATLAILDATGEKVNELAVAATAGIHEVVWDLRLAPPSEDTSGQRGGFFGPARGPRVMPGSYTVRLEAAGETSTAPLTIKGDPRITISHAERLARQEALMSLYALARSVEEAGRALQELNKQVSSAQELLKASDLAPEALVDEADSLRSELRRITGEVNRARRDSRLSNAVDGATAGPTGDQLWQIERAWERVPKLVDRLNEIINTRLPDLYRGMNEHGIRPNPGPAIILPKKPGG
ncbi:MAG: hypothetical protein ACE5HT_05980, partial [Gemmatimonadales bacterium]